MRVNPIVALVVIAVWLYVLSVHTGRSFMRGSLS